MEKIPKDTFLNPAVGTYNPYIVTSLEYEVKSKINPYIDDKKVGFGIQEKKNEQAFIPKDNNRNIGPGRYYKEKKNKLKQNNVPFNQSNKRFNYSDKFQISPGPGGMILIHLKIGIKNRIIFYLYNLKL